MKTNKIHLQVTRPALCRSLSVAGLAVATMLVGTCIASAQATFTKITTGLVVTNAGIGWAAAWGDFDNDGFIDLVVGNEGADFLYRNNRNGTFTSITNSPVVETESDGGGGVAFADYDNDGHLDLIVGGYGGPPTKLFRNSGDGTFTKLVGNPPAAVGNASSANWGDYDNDGYPDLMITRFGGTSLLYRNNGDGSFTQMPPEVVGNIASDRGQAIAGVWSDYDNDGDLDMLVTYGGQGTIAFHRNNGDGTFTRLFRADIGDLDDSALRNPTGAAWGDFDNDGDLDVFVTQGGTLSLSNDALYRNNGDGTFTKMESGVVGPLVNDQQPGFGCAWADYDNDGWLDLYATNPGLSLSGGESGRMNLLYHNNGDGSFTQITNGSPVTDVASSTGGIWGDYDNDGFMDLFVANGNFAGPQADSLYRNDGNTNSWLKLKLIGTVSNRSAIGAKVRVKATIKGTSVWQMREISGGDGFFSQNDLRPNFGLGNATNVETLRIEWPSGTVQELRNVPANQILTVTEPVRLQVTGKGAFQFKSWNGMAFTVQTSTNLADWSALLRVTNATGTMLFNDPAAANFARRFYRVATP